MHIEELRLYWDEKVERFLEGRCYMDDALIQWRKAYDGRGAGTVVMDAFPEPYVGSIFPGDARGVVFGLNPGRAFLDFQARDSIFADEIRQLGSYSSWSATWPYMRDPWDSVVGPNRYPRSRWRFLQRWFDEPSMPMSGLLTFELFPWHSSKVTASMTPDPRIVHDFVLDPLVTLGIDIGFAFGAPWFPIVEHLAVNIIARLGSGGTDYGSSVPSRSVLVAELDEGFVMIAEKHLGSAGPPSAAETHLLRESVRRLGVR